MAAAGTVVRGGLVVALVLWAMAMLIKDSSDRYF